LLHRYFARFPNQPLTTPKFRQFLKQATPHHLSPPKPSVMSAPASKFKVADLSLAAFGRKEIELAEVHYPANYSRAKLTSIDRMKCQVSWQRGRSTRVINLLRERELPGAYSQCPLKRCIWPNYDAYIRVSMTIQTAVLIETLTFLGAEVRHHSPLLYQISSLTHNPGNLDLLQHLFYPRPCCRRHCSSGCSSICVERRNRGRVRMVPRAATGGIQGWQDTESDLG
jgi:hypothetical protein